MEEGEFYSIEGFMLEYTGEDHYTVSVEFEQADTAGHHQANKEVQILSIDPENTEEKFEITVNGAVGNTYQVKFINPKHDPTNRRSILMHDSGVIVDTDAAWRVRRQIVNYFYSIWGSNVEVVKVSYDADDIETTDSSLVVKTVYTVTVLRQINGPSFTTASIVMVSGDTVNVAIGAPIQQSTPPLSGAF